MDEKKGRRSGKNCKVNVKKIVDVDMGVKWKIQLVAVT